MSELMFVRNIDSWKRYEQSEHTLGFVFRNEVAKQGTKLLLKMLPLKNQKCARVCSTTYVPLPSVS